MTKPNAKPEIDFNDLIAKAKAGDEESFELLYKYYFEPLRRYILIRVGDADEADDLVQTVFVKFHRNLQTWQDKGFAPSAYLYTVARSVIADYYRSNARKGSKLRNSEEVLSFLKDESQSPHGDVIHNEEMAALYNSLHQLPQNYQEILLLRYMQDMSSSEISKIIGKSDVATRKMLSRATTALAKTHNSKMDNMDTK